MKPLLGAELVAGYGLSAHQVAQLESVLRAIESDEHAPTTVRDAHEAADVHVADALVALTVSVLAAASRVADLGAGAGFPGVVLAIALPETEVRLVESQRRKCDFLARLCATAQIANARVVCTRAEEWSEGLLDNDVVVARALAGQPVVLEYAAPLLPVGGWLLDWRGRRNRDEEQAEELGFARTEIRKVEPFPAARDRHLHLFEKLKDTPGRFPRRVGMARKRPLGA
jgi:16S rRNA (guanine527-N7)-methyltransferase